MRTILEIKINTMIFYIFRLKDEIEKKFQFHNRIKKIIIIRTKFERKKKRGQPTIFFN